MRDEFGRSGGAGPTRGRKAAVYEVTLPDGRKVRKNKFGNARDQNPVLPAECPASVLASYSNPGKVLIGIWTDGHVAWPSDAEFGGGVLTARRVK